MSSMSEDIQCTGFDTRPPMLYRTDFESWQQRIRLYCLGKDNGENIMKSINEGLFHMGTVSDVIAAGTEGAFQQGPVRARVLNDLLTEEKKRYKADRCPTISYFKLNSKFVNNMLPEWSRFITEVKLNRGLKESNFDQLYAYLKQHEFIQLTAPPHSIVKSYLPQTNRINSLEPSSLTARNKATVQDGRVVVQDLGILEVRTEEALFNPGQAKPLSATLTSEEQSLFFARRSADQCDAFDSDVDEAPNVQTMFMVNLSSEDPIYDKAGPSHDSNTPFEVQDHDTFVDHMDEYHEVHEMQNDVHHNYVVDSNAKYMSDSNIIPYNQYLEDNEENGVQSNVSSIQNNALMSIINEMHEDGVQQGVQSRLANKPDKVVNDSLTSELARFKELVGEYEKRAKILIKKKSIYLEEFLDIKRLKEKVEDRLYKQDQSVQMVHMLCKPKSFYDEKNKVAIGYKNPLYLTRAKQAQSALYNGHVLVTTNHTPTVVHDSEDTREIAEITRKRMLLKINLTPEQIFWSIDDNNRKKAETLAPKPISALTVYPPNTPVKLVPRILPTKSQVKINLYVLTQLFTEFDKTCKTRITPTGVTEGERGFEQTKRCYLTEVIPFFKTLKEHFVGVQTALFKEVKEMEEIFDQMNNEVDKNTIDKQCAEIVKKNLLIENENLIANYLSNQLLYDVEKSRCLDLEADMSKVHNESKHISKLEREYLNLQLKYQHLQESFDNKKSHTVQEAPDFNSFFKIKNLEHQIQEKDNVIRDLKVLVANVNDRSCEPYNAKDVTALIEQNDCVRVELEKVKQHYKELYDSIKITRAHTSEKTSTMLNEIESLKAQLRSKESCFTSDSVKPKVLAPGMYAIDVKPIPHPLKNNRSAHLNYISHLKESVEIVREIIEEARVVKPLDNALNYACQYTKLSQEKASYF
ncbi:hypothetical protein Tco_1570820 [Tanacetum coccineum]